MGADMMLTQAGRGGGAALLRGRGGHGHARLAGAADAGLPGDPALRQD